jgi:DNA invertase Pin-like site-specific DNA recombinase
VLSKRDIAELGFAAAGADEESFRPRAPHSAASLETVQLNPVFYRDKFTGKVMERPGWQKLWADVLAGKVDRIVVWGLDRLGRTVSGLSRLFEELQARKVGLVSLRDGLDLNTASGRLMAHVLASVAAYELEVKSERQAAGIEAARAENGGKCPWGGRRAGTRVKVTEEVEAAIREMARAGDSIASIARVCGLRLRSMRF